MVVLYEVVIANRGDDTLRSVILACNSEDFNAQNHITQIAPEFSDLGEMFEEYITNIRRILPKNMGTTKDSWEEVNKVFGL